MPLLVPKKTSQIQVPHCFVERQQKNNKNKIPFNASETLDVQIGAC